ncbi:MAG: dihydrolipoyl dehydrogenase [Candidatus Nephthysia bennettiae]|uniref:Dihydrolipoyl dehydrogenase n=1 Tax=Candidatus Nephthysia bennettiae TaxID=3127016 RepID=A0A934N8D2_9BACT|nr:dihydrolipoyl dehydrogenase [Candidatus Dormibacteraeota bacterium]MBJ7614158.1 dihydrolipoyl dehydrogenase [Candidatus Dormibacteraeota bacterium]PZR97833.1 MAG: dihydrolipoyl dehydrogenase [Candidatus Dormibacteraeota bacterium]
MADFDLTVIGSGPGGYVAAIHAARLGARVAILEQKDSEWGGTCLNWGCIPAKALVQSAEVLQAVRRAGEFGVRVGEPEVDWPAMQARKDSVVKNLRQGVQGLLKANGVEMITARGRLLGGNRVSADGRQLDSSNLLLAPGSVVSLPPFPGADLGLTSDTILGLEQVPESLVVIGGGVVGMEFAGVFSLLGTQVTVVEMLDHLLAPLDPDVARRFQQLMAKRGVRFHLGARVEAVERSGAGFSVRSSAGELLGEQVLVATGRRPNTADLGLEEASVATERAAITVDRHLRTNQDGVYAIGDATGISMLAHTASYQGEVAVTNALSEKRISADYSTIPACVYTDPEIAYVGMSEARARADGMEIRVGQFPFSALGRAQVLGEVQGLVKVVAGSDGYLLGVTIMGPRATDLIAEAVLAVNQGLSAAELSHAVHAHPTLPEALAEAALDVAGRAVHIPPRRR